MDQADQKKYCVATINGKYKWFVVMGATHDEACPLVWAQRGVKITVEPTTCPGVVLLHSERPQAVEDCLKLQGFISLSQY